MNVINVMMTVILVGVVAYILFNPKNRATDIVGALGKGSMNFIRTLSGQYEGGAYQ